MPVLFEQLQNIWHFHVIVFYKLVADIVFSCNKLMLEVIIHNFYDLFLIHDFFLKVLSQSS